MTELLREIDPKVTRDAGVTAEYAQAVREVGREADVPVLDVWTAFMERAGWKEGDVLNGTKELGKDPVLKTLLSDGRLSAWGSGKGSDADKSRIALDGQRI